MSSRIQITLNARLRPLDRGARYEDPLQEVLDARAPGSQVTGGGTLLTVEREPFCSDIDLEVEGDVHQVLRLVIAALEAAGVPRGSRVQLDDSDPVTFGITEGLAVYLNGTDLPGEVYAASDVNDLIAALLERLGPEGDMQSYWEGPHENGAVPVRSVRRPHGGTDRRRAGPVSARAALPGSAARAYAPIQELTRERGLSAETWIGQSARSAADADIRSYSA